MAAKCLPILQTHVNGLFAARVFVGDDSLARNAIVRHCNDFAAELVVLSLPISVKGTRWHGDEWHVLVDLIGKVGAESASAILPKRLTAFVRVAKHEDGAVALAGDRCTFGLLLSGGGRCRQNQGSGDC